MSNRSYLYLKNDQSTRVLCEGIVQVPLFWQCLWGEKELAEPIQNWKTAVQLEEDEQAAFWETAEIDVLVSIEQMRHYAQTNRDFIATCFPDQLVLYDQFLAYIDSNVQAEDVLGLGVVEIVEMGEVEEAEAEFFGNQQAIRQNDKSLIGVNNLYGHSVFADFTGYTNYYVDQLADENRLITDDDVLAEPASSEQSSEDKKAVSSQSVTEPLSSAIEEPSVSDQTNWKWFGLVIAFVVVLLRYFLT